MGSSTVSSTAGVKSGNRSCKTVDNGLGCLQAGIKEENYKLRRSVSCDISRLETIQSSGCSYHSSRSLSKYGTEHNNCTTGLKKSRSKSSTSALRDCSKDKAGCVKQLKHKIQSLPSRKDNFCEITVSEKFPANCKRQEHSASEERRKFMHNNSHSTQANVYPISNRNRCSTDLESNDGYQHHLQTNSKDPCCNCCNDYQDPVFQDSCRKFSHVITVGHDCHEFQAPNVTSCNHDKYCYSESISCSHEKLCPCQRISSLPRKHKSESNSLQNNCCLLETDVPNNKTLKQLVEPLNSVRLKPKRIL
ncbi:hypothetical protein X975_06907, partial [Stegodyphus mimosarum]